MPVLALDTSAAVAVALTTDDGAPLAVRRVTEERRHAELLGPMITEVLADAGTDRHTVTAVVVGTGPAPFTGLRVGLVTARTLALALGVPVLGVCSLDALAVQAADDLGLAPGTDVLVVTDARRREVYWARYRRTPAGDVDLVAGPGVERPDRLASSGAGDGAVVVGRGTALYPDALPGGAGAPLDPEPAVLARIALGRRARGVELPTEPLYLRRPDVVEPGARKRALGVTGVSAEAVAELRPLTVDDLPVLGDLERELFGPAAWSPAMLAEELTGPDRWYVAAVHRAPLGGTTVVGYAGLWFDGDDAQVMTIGVAAAHQGRRVGGLLLAALVDRARELGAASVLLEVRVDNEPALALYRRFGFVTLGRRRGYYQPENADAWTMRLDLTASGTPGGAR